jgi:type IV pilus assembly protein PilA
MFSSAIDRLKERRSGASESGVDAGFTLIELMVVLLILAILLAIAIPTFLGVTGGANDRAAQSAATNNGQQYGGGTTPITQTLLTTNEPSIHWVAGSTSTQGYVSWYVSSDGEGVILASPSKNGNTCWYAVDNLQAITANAGGNGAYGTTAVAAGSATQAPSGAGTFYSHGPMQVVGGVSVCNSNAAITGASTWGGSF